MRDEEERKDGTPRLQRLRQIPPAMGKFLARLAANTPEEDYLEINTSAGFSTFLIAKACKMLGRSITTFEVLSEKAKPRRETFQVAQMEGVVKLIEGDAQQSLSQYSDIAFCFLDAEIEVSDEYYEAVIPSMVKGGWLVADNAINHREILQPVLERALADVREDALIVPFGKGELVCRKV